MKNTKLSLADLDRECNAALRLGRMGDAMRLCGQMMKLAPTNDFYPLRYVYYAENMKVNNHDPEMKRIVTTCLKTPGIEYQKLASLWASLLMTGPVYAFLFDPAIDDTKFLNRIDTLCQDEFFLLGLKKLIPLEPVVEKSFTRLRRLMMQDIINDTKIRNKHLPLLCAFATLCFYNEYCWPETHAEKDMLASFTPEDAIGIALCGCYRPLYTYAHAPQWVEAHTKGPLADLLHIQVVNPLEERALQSTIKSFSSIAETTSQAVQSMYEENPYPRWHTMDQPRRDFPEVDIDWLTAGCGTGRPLSQISACYPNARITAIDLSRASIAYAMRRTHELNIHNIDFFQGDILDVSGLERDFDFIESSGVLHHMKDPVAGWKALLNCLRPGGRMQIGLYSKIARDVILKVRDYIKEQNYSYDIDGIRRLRTDMMELSADHPLYGITRRRDFFSASECRDLVFHVQEYNYTIPELATILDDLGLAFLGFKLSDAKRNAYAARFPQDPLQRNLDNWHILEQENPLLFVGMYIFFCCRKDEIDTPREAWKTLDKTGILAIG